MSKSKKPKYVQLAPLRYLEDEVAEFNDLKKNYGYEHNMSGFLKWMIARGIAALREEEAAVARMKKGA